MDFQNGRFGLFCFIIKFNKFFILCHKIRVGHKLNERMVIIIPKTAPTAPVIIPAIALLECLGAAPLLNIPKNSNYSGITPRYAQHLTELK